MLCHPKFGSKLVNSNVFVSRHSLSVTSGVRGFVPTQLQKMYVAVKAEKLRPLTRKRTVDSKEKQSAILNIITAKQKFFVLHFFFGFLNFGTFLTFP